jgi:type III secretion system low calcium response chaperone LcrH/SycD
MTVNTPANLDLDTPEGIASAFLEHGVTPADLQGMTEEELEAVYAEAVDRIEREEFSEALDLGVFLVTHQPWDRRFHFVFALCLQHLGDYESAARHYSQCYMLDATDAACAYRIGECLEALGQVEEAREAYRSALDLSFAGEGLPELRDAAQSRLDFISTQPA